MTPFAPTLDDLVRAMALDAFDGRAAQRKVEPTDRGDVPAGSQAKDVRDACKGAEAREMGAEVAFAYAC